MHYKVLLIGHNRLLIDDLFLHLGSEFDLLNSSERFDDIINHIKYTKPDAIVHCLFKESASTVSEFCKTEQSIIQSEAPVFILGDAQDCDTFEEYAPNFKATILRKPINTHAIQEHITKAIEKKLKAQRLREELINSSSELADLFSELEAEPKKRTINIPFVKEERKRKHILVVDDDLNVLKMMKGILAPSYDVATAISGKIALKFLESKSTDLIILDYAMPAENGPQVLAKIREHENLRDIPVLFLTGVTEREKIAEALAMKPQGYLLKPIDVDKVLTAVNGIWE